MDKTKYSFENGVFGKSRLVLAIVKKHVLDNPDLEYSQLEKIFPKELQGNFGVFTTKDDAENIYKKYKYKRHYINVNEIIKLKTGDIAVCSQWGIDNINRIIDVAKRLGYKIEIV